MKLFTIGDSVSQGFMSAAAARTDLSLSTLIAQKLGLQVQSNDYRHPEWAAGGIPLNLENILRALNQRYGSNIRLLEWLTVLQTINGVVDLAEDFYERGEGAADRPTTGGVEFFHNVAVKGFDAADAWLMTPRIAREKIAETSGPRPRDQFLRGPDAAFYRTALRVLNPSLQAKYDDYSQLRWLEHHATNEGVDNLVLWLGANNALGTVLALKVRQTPNNANRRPHTLTHAERAAARWNLWHPDDFEAEYRELIRRVNAAMSKNQQANWRVFAGTVPLVTIAPLAKGVGETTKVPNKGIYYKYYTYFPFGEDFAKSSGIALTFSDALHIDDCIRAYNDVIRKVVDEQNVGLPSPRYHLVDMEKVLNAIAFKRNNGQPTYQFPDYFRFIYPPVNTKYYHADADGRMTQGGLFTLDGVHPTPIAHGIIAYEFLNVMLKAGVAPDTDLPWPKIFANDLLYQRPISIMREIYEHQQLAEHIIRLIQLLRD